MNEYFYELGGVGLISPLPDVIWMSPKVSSDVLRCDLETILNHYHSSLSGITFVLVCSVSEGALYVTVCD